MDTLPAAYGTGKDWKGDWKVTGKGTDLFLAKAKRMDPKRYGQRLSLEFFFLPQAQTVRSG
ncbi:hypothetical protein [Pseudomonas fluorescens]|uniref:Uncharacterized protein n=1 Tax=Pseudomonas fluorescens TaxID=294 RepID=A0A5E7CXM6_PSEFL|nr:hypothetical protein [Pseudomonas fluorescens]VVO09777.1 hypothetical protein PS833_03331 [Pseudomonas fluorescens]